MIYLKLLIESFLFALNALRANLLRTVLSLLGVTIGILLIISVFTIVDSLERSIKDSLNFLGSDNINVDKWPYGLGGGPYPWWKYLSRPVPTHEEFEFLQDNLKNAAGITIIASRGGNIATFGNNSAVDVALVGVAYGHKDVYEMPIENGRYFTLQETVSGRNLALLGHRIAADLFPNGDATGQIIKLKGQKFYVVGKLKEEGDGFLGAPSNDNNIYVPFKTFGKLYYTGDASSGITPSISVKGLPGDEKLEQLEGELRGLMRTKRGLKPREEDNFALNRPEAVANFIGSAFDAIGLAGWFIGGFAIMVGGFGTANIMFVSVRERTHIIGIQKSLGAKNYFILFQFLFESVFLCIIGGGVGIFLVFLLSLASLGSLELVLSWGNILTGIGLSTFIGVLAGIVPAIQASRLDPVIAIRTQ